MSMQSRDRSGYYQLIKNQSSSTKVGVVVDANCMTDNDCTDGWDATVLANAAGYYDFVEYHFYAEYGDVTSDTVLVQQAVQTFTYNINVIKSELAAAGATGTPIFVGEVGANPLNPGTQSWSITQGLYAGQLLGEAMNDGVARLAWWMGFGNCSGPRQQRRYALRLAEYLGRRQRLLRRTLRHRMSGCRTHRHHVAHGAGVQPVQVRGERGKRAGRRRIHTADHGSRR